MNRLEEEVGVTQERGYGFEDQELREDVRRVAAPVNSNGDPVGCIGLASTIFSFDKEDMDEYGRIVLEAATKASADLALPIPPGKGRVWSVEKSKVIRKKRRIQSTFGLYLSSRLEFYICYWAVVRLGGIAVLLNPMLKKNEIQHILSDTQT